MHTGAHRYRLSVGFQDDRVVRGAFIALYGTAAAVAAGFIGFMVGLVGIGIVAPGDPDGIERWGFLPFVVAGGFAALVMIFTALLTTIAVRTDAWLEGTRLTVRGLGERTIDIASARSVALHQTNRRLRGAVSRAGAIGPDQRVTVLVVTAGSGTVRLPLASREAIPLPAEQLQVLANVLSVARCSGGAEVVAWLRAAAARAR
ncbi:hypothetical protein ABGB07_26750 [Micromonosporaceae bacterium B7E4]